PRWFLVGASPTEPEEHETPLHAWQSEALEAWAGQGHKGIVEAVTGTGKTLVGIESIRQSVEIGARALVLVPTVELLLQWSDQLATQFPDRRIGQLGDGRTATWR